MTPTLPRRGRFAAVLLAAASAAALAACSDDPTGPHVGDIVLQPVELRLRQLEEHRVTATVTDAEGTLLSGVAVTFASKMDAAGTEVTGATKAIALFHLASMAQHRGDLVTTQRC